MVSRSLRVAFIHPDLGIGTYSTFRSSRFCPNTSFLSGGAERLVVDAALGLQALGHAVDIYTSHHDPSHCFEETRDGEVET
jgi:alpha-1,3/alpha-1,6-mannosyltransferase